MKQIPQKRGGTGNQKKKKVSNDSSQDEGSSHGAINPIYVNGVEIDIETITDAQLIELRKVLPRKQYRLLKNRKSARKSRRRRKAELISLKEEIQKLRSENQALKDKVAALESEQSRTQEQMKMETGGILRPTPINPFYQCLILPHYALNQSCLQTLNKAQVLQVPEPIRQQQAVPCTNNGPSII